MVCGKMSRGDADDPVAVELGLRYQIFYKRLLSVSSGVVGAKVILLVVRGEARLPI